MGVTDISKVNKPEDLRRDDTPPPENIPDYFTDLDEIQCPHCGTIQPFDSGEPAMYTENPIVCKCGDCGKTYTVYGSMSWSWSTEANSDR